MARAYDHINEQVLNWRICHICFDETDSYYSDNRGGCLVCNRGACNEHQKECDVCVNYLCIECMIGDKCHDCIAVIQEYKNLYPEMTQTHVICSTIKYVGKFRKSEHRRHYDDTIDIQLKNKPISPFNHADETNAEYVCQYCGMRLCSNCMMYSFGNDGDNIICNECGNNQN
jgi:hypothetical protein